MRRARSWLATLGRPVLAFLAGFGRATLFLLAGLAAMARPPFYIREFGHAFVTIGYFSLPVVGLTAFFTGGALALQIFDGSARFNAEAVVPSIVAIGMVRELGPVLGGLMVAARVASSISAEIATMRVTEQIDALVTLSTDPMRYLVAPRLLAGLLALPLLVAVGDIIGIMGGWFVGLTRLGFHSAVYLQTTVEFLEVWDVVSGLIKGAVFGLIITFMGCYYGMNAQRGARGVGRATKSAVVAASIGILAANYLLTELFFSA
ncbi:MAG: ABC transporter permease [Pseudomonadota bacterium]